MNGRNGPPQLLFAFRIGHANETVDAILQEGGNALNAGGGDDYR